MTHANEHRRSDKPQSRPSSGCPVRRADEYIDVAHCNAFCHGSTQICQPLCHFVTPETGIQSSKLQARGRTMLPIWTRHMLGHDYAYDVHRRISFAVQEFRPTRRPDLAMHHELFAHRRRFRYCFLPCTRARRHLRFQAPHHDSVDDAITSLHKGDMIEGVQGSPEPGSLLSTRIH